MNRKIKAIVAIFAVLLVFSMASCTGGSSGGKSFNSAEDLKAYLDKQPVNTPDKPIKISMTINDPMIKNVAAVIKSAGKYVSLNITGNALTAIPDYAFHECISLTSVTIPDSVTIIDSYAFSGCTSLTSVTIPNSVTIIDSYAFSGCTSLASVTIPHSVKGIGRAAFARCTGLTGITIPNSVISIVTMAFRECTSLTGITIPNSVTSIEDWAFFGCTGLTSVTFEGTITSRDFDSDIPFPGDLRAKYLAGGIGTYTRPSGESNTWTKQ